MKFHERRIEGEKFTGHLKGLGDHALARQRGLRGAKLGPANEGRRLTDDEKKAIEATMKLKGKL